MTRSMNHHGDGTRTVRRRFDGRNIQVSIGQELRACRKYMEKVRVYRVNSVGISIDLLDLFPIQAIGFGSVVASFVCRTNPESCPQKIPLSRIIALVRHDDAFTHPLEQLEIEELAPSILQLVTEFIEADSCALYLRRDGQLELREARPAAVAFNRPRTLDMSRGITGAVATDKRTITVRDVMAEATPSEIMAQPLLMATIRPSTDTT